VIDVQVLDMPALPDGPRRGHRHLWSPASRETKYPVWDYLSSIADSRETVQKGQST
jgi:hypothetical protein